MIIESCFLRTTKSFGEYDCHSNWWEVAFPLLKSWLLRWAQAQPQNDMIDCIKGLCYPLHNLLQVRKLTWYTQDSGVQSFGRSTHKQNWHMFWKDVFAIV